MKTFYISDVGKERSMNQDYAFASREPVGNLKNLYIVADGMGGHKAGDYASKFTVEKMVDVISNDTQVEPIKILKHAIHIANQGLIVAAKEEESLHGMGTTVVVATILDSYLYIANVGDSRLYIIDDTIKQITRDHSLVEEMIRLGEIDKDCAKVHPDKNIITRAIGAIQNLEIDFFEVHMKGNEIILMCSDGLTNMIDDEEIGDLLKREQGIEEKVEELVRVANYNGGKDNITVIVIEPFSSEVKEC